MLRICIALVDVYVYLSITYGAEKRIICGGFVGTSAKRIIILSLRTYKVPTRCRLVPTRASLVSFFQKLTGECRLVRGDMPRYVDQYTTPEPQAPVRRDVNGTVWERDRKVRDAALSRAKGRCELCKQRGFRMVGGRIYVETHHVIPLSEKGVDHERNVVALCPNDHREAHHGERREEIRNRLLAMLAEMYG